MIPRLKCVVTLHLQWYTQARTHGCHPPFSFPVLLLDVSWVSSQEEAVTIPSCLGGALLGEHDEAGGSPGCLPSGGDWLDIFMHLLLLLYYLLFLHWFLCYIWDLPYVFCICSVLAHGSLCSSQTNFCWVLGCVPLVRRTCRFLPLAIYFHPVTAPARPAVTLWLCSWGPVLQSLGFPSSIYILYHSVGIMIHFKIQIDI